MLTAMETVMAARKTSRPTALEYFGALFDDFIELHGDRHYKDDQAVVGGIAFFEARPVTVIGIQKGHNMEDNIRRNFGSPHPEGYRKALRLMKQAEKFNRPVVLFVNTSGAFCGVEAEERGQGEAIAQNLLTMSSLRTPLITILTGEGGSGGALALALADRVWMLEYAIYSILSPEGFASILWKDARRAGEAAALMKLTATDLLDMEIIDKIIPEPPGGVESDKTYTMEILKKELTGELETLAGMDMNELLDRRYDRFRKFGVYTEM